MDLPKGYLPRERDVVLVRATVKLPYEAGDPYVHVDVGHRAIGIQLSDIASVESHAWSVGDIARIAAVRGRHDPGALKLLLECRGECQIAAIINDWAWVVLRGGGNPLTVQIKDLEPFTLTNQPSLDGAEGADLDLLGAIYGVLRVIGEGDADYRKRIEVLFVAESRPLPVPPMVPRRDAPDEREPPFEPDPPGTLTEQPIDPEDVF